MLSVFKLYIVFKYHPVYVVYWPVGSDDIFLGYEDHIAVNDL